MKKILDLISEQVTAAFVQAGYDEKYGKVTISNRPDLCEYQCNGALAAAKQYHKALIMIAKDVAAILENQDMSPNRKATRSKRKSPISPQFTAPIIAMVRAVPSKYLLPIKSPYPVCMKFAAAKSIQTFF